MADRSTALGSRGGRVLTPGLTTFLVVDVILVATFLVLLVMSLANGSGGTAPAPTSPPTATQPPEPETEPEESAPPEPDDVEHLAQFVLPSGNIHCAMTETTATCTILSFSYEPPAPPPGCDGTVGPVLTVTADQDAAFACLDSPPQGAAPGTAELEYGAGNTVGEMTCLSSRNGVFCRHNPSGKGFSVARAGYHFF